MPTVWHRAKCQAHVNLRILIYNLGKKKNIGIVVGSPSKLNGIQWNKLIKGRCWISRIKGQIQIRRNSHRVNSRLLSMFTQNRWFILMRYDAMQFITLLQISSIETIDDKLAMNFACRLINADYLHFRHNRHTCDLIKLIRIAIPLEWASMHIAL